MAFIKKSMQKLVCLCVCAALLFAVALPCAAESEKTVKIGCIDFDGFFSADSNGDYYGYGVDLLRRISKYTGWKYEYVYDSWSNQLENLKTGKIDFFCHAQKTPERAENYIFSACSAGAESSIMYVRSDDERYYYNDYGYFDGMSIALLANSYQNGELAECAEKNGFSYVPYYYETEDEAFEALDSGTVDGVAMGSLAAKKGYKVVCRFGSEPFYFMSGKQNQALVDTLDAAMSEVINNYPSLINDLATEYYGSSDSLISLNITRDEALYIQYAEAISVGNLSDCFPLSSFDDNTGASGIIEDILTKISGLTGLEFNIQPIGSDENPVAAAKNEKYDLVAGVPLTDEIDSDVMLRVSDGMFAADVAAVMQKGNTFDPAKTDYKVIVPQSLRNIQDIILKNHPDYSVVLGVDRKECIKKLISGEADIFMQNVYTVNYYMQKPQYDCLEVAVPGLVSESLCIASSVKTDPLLISIINKALACISDDDIDRIIIENTTGKSYQLTAADMLYKYRLTLYITGASLIILVSLIVFISILRQRNMKLLTRKNIQLGEAVAHAEHSEKVKGEFLSRMSHEIRTPMNAIAGLTEITRIHAGEPQKVEECLDKIKASSEMLLSIINDVLDMSAIENEKLKISYAEFDMNELIERISSIYYSQCRNKGVGFRAECELSDERLIGDSLRVNQVLMNLVSNAFKFTDTGGEIILRVWETGRKEGKSFVRMTVADTGCGMSQEMLSRLFIPFEQESAQTAAKHGGSGLGLSITHNLINMMHGAISVESEKGSGTVFTVDLPFGLPETDETDKIDEPEIPLEKQYDFSGMRALIAEDNEINREITCELLGFVNLNTECAANGREAVAMFKNSPKGYYNIVLMDIQMPEMNGFEAAKAIRALSHPDSGKIHILAMTANAFSSDVTASLSSGMNGHISKPIDTEFLYKAVSKHIIGR